MSQPCLSRTCCFTHGLFADTRRCAKARATLSQPFPAAAGEGAAQGKPAMNTSVAMQFKRSETVAALAIGCVALLVLGLQPALLGALVDQHRISMEGVGIVAMGEIFSLGIGTVLAEKWLPLHRLSTVAVVASLLLIAIDLLTLTAHGDLACVAWRVAAG